MAKAMPGAVEANIRTVIEMQEQQDRRRTRSDQIGDAIGSFAGTLTFVILHLVVFVGWAAVNRGIIPGLPAFDPYPFNLLTMIVSMEGVLISTFVLIKQNRMSVRADRRDHLDLQINLLTEKEATKLIQMLTRISQHLKIPIDDDETRELSELTAVGSLAETLDEKLPEDK